MRKLLIAVAVLGLVGVVGFQVGNKAAHNNEDIPPPAQDFSSADKEIMQDTLQNMEKLAETYDGQYQSVSMLRASNEIANQALDNGTDLEKRQTAAGVFSGYMARNTIGLKEYCDQQGVDMTPFVDKFIKHNAPMAEVAQKYYVVENQVESAFAEMKDTVMRMVDMEMQDVAKMLKYPSTKESCVFMNDSADRILSKASFKDLVPAAYAVLDAAK